MGLIMKNDLKKAVLATVPVLTGYLVLGFGFGILMRSAGFGIGLSVAMSLMVYAGSMQYAAVGLLGGVLPERGGAVLSFRVGPQPDRLRGGGLAPCLETEHAAQYFRWDSLLYGTGADGLLIGDGSGRSYN